MVTVTTTVEIDLDEFETDTLIAELKSRGHIDNSLSWWDIDYLMNLLPNDIKPGSEQYFIYEKLRAAKQNAAI